MIDNIIIEIKQLLNSIHNGIYRMQIKTISSCHEVTNNKNIYLREKCKGVFINAACPFRTRKKLINLNFENILQGEFYGT